MNFEEAMCEHNASYTPAMFRSFETKARNMYARKCLAHWRAQGQDVSCRKIESTQATVDRGRERNYLPTDLAKRAIREVIAYYSHKVQVTIEAEEREIEGRAEEIRSLPRFA